MEISVPFLLLDSGPSPSALKLLLARTLEVDIVLELSPME
jgi:hypothetical protein